MNYSYKKILSLVLVLAMSLALLAGCGSSGGNSGNNSDNNSGTNDQNTESGAKAGTYNASAQGYSSEVKVTVVVADDGTISDIQVDASGETAELGGKAAPAICEAVKENQSLAVDTVTGATMTSNATLTALEDALTQAGADVDALKNKTIAQQ